jgi:hypothetical protein
VRCLNCQAPSLASSNLHRPRNPRSSWRLVQEQAASHMRYLIEIVSRNRFGDDALSRAVFGEVQSERDSGPKERDPDSSTAQPDISSPTP